MNATSPELAIPVSAQDHAQGKAGAPVTLLEYGDYQCPACGMAYPTIKRIQHAFGADLRFVFRNFPLSEVHPLARPAAEIAEAAAILHHFWPMHDWLYENQDTWTVYGTEGLEAGLRDLGIDEAAITRTLREHDVGARVRSDFMGGVRSGVNGTPCFFVNGYRHDGDAASLEYAIANLIEQA
ncbi:MAG: DsbA family protein [Rhodanobacteraceae bacterium]|nr:MAG: DsbA family protein [Rhodanobacteraceae bacterium]